MKTYNLQKGKCFYTAYALVCKFGEGLDRDALSFDRLIPELGYVQGNVVLCTQKANTIKSDLTLQEIKKWLPSWFKKMIKILKDNNVVGDGDDGASGQ